MSLDFNTLSAITADKFIPLMVDNIFESNPLALKLLKDAEKLDGGMTIITPLEYAKNTAQGFYTGYDVLDLTPADPGTAATWQWVSAYSAISISGEEQHKNRGSSAILSLLKTKVKNAEKSFKDLFGTTIMTNAARTTTQLTSLIGTGVVASGVRDDDAYIEADATYFSAPGNIDNCIISINRSLGTINSDTYTWWDARFGSFATLSGTIITACTWDELLAAVTGTNVIAIHKKMAQMYGALSVNNDHPDLIITTQVLYDAYEASMEPSKRRTGDAMWAKYGYETLKFKNADVVVDSHVPDGMMIFLNTKYLGFKVHKDRNFKFEPFQKAMNQDAMTAKVFWMGQLFCTNARMQGVVVGGPANY